MIISRNKMKPEAIPPIHNPAMLLKVGIVVFLSLFCTSVSLAQDCEGVPATIASSPSPSDGQLSVAFTATISWTADDECTTSSQLYFGTTPELGIDTFQGQQTSPWTPPNQLDPLTTYYWQIVTFNIEGPDTQGPVWSFDTGVPTGVCCFSIDNGVSYLCIQAPEDACGALGDFYG
jgi:hypothetical protein